VIAIHSEQLLSLSEAAESFARENSSAKLLGVRLELERTHSKRTLALRRWAFLENLSANGRLSNAWLDKLGLIHVTEGVPDIHQLEPKVGARSHDVG
jgi:hypothetical protein